MNVAALARQYASALYTVATHKGRTAEVGQDLQVFTALLTTSDDLRALATAPAVSPRKKRAVIDAILAASGDSTTEVPRLLTLLADRDRLALLPDISRAYTMRVDEAERVVAADVVTAVDLPADKEQALARALGQATGRQVTIRSRVDPEILGGVVARVGTMVFDASVAGQLQRLRQRLAASV